ICWLPVAVTRGNMVALFFTRVGRNCDLPQIIRMCALFATWPGPRRGHRRHLRSGYAATQPDLGWTSKPFVETPERFSTHHAAAAWASSRKSLGSTGAA